MFIFDMTIQNHGGYLTNTNWENPVYVEDSYYTEAKEFLSATKVSDDAFKYLVEYFEKRKTQLLYVCLETTGLLLKRGFMKNCLENLRKNGNLRIYRSVLQLLFVIWANYDIDEGIMYL